MVNVKHIRAHLGLTRAELSILVHTSESVLKDMEDGFAKQKDYEIILRIAHLVGAGIDDILYKKASLIFK